VADLTAADFEIQDDGKKTPIVAFLPVDVSEAASGGEAGSLVQAAARRQILFLFDLTFSTPGGIVRARQAAAAFVRESLAPSDLAAVATFSQKGADVLVSFTPDRAQVEAAIYGLGVVEPQARMRDVLSIAYDLGLPRWGSGDRPAAGGHARGPDGRVPAADGSSDGSLGPASVSAKSRVFPVRAGRARAHTRLRAGKDAADPALGGLRLDRTRGGAARSRRRRPTRS
jgi:hypothetical protein